MAAPRPRRKRGGPWGMIAVVVVVLLVAAFLVYSAIGKKSSGTTYTTAQPTRGTLSVTVAGNGSVISKNQASVNPAISGTVKRLRVSVGTHVTKGDVLFVIDNPKLDAGVTQAEASYQQSKSGTYKAQQQELQADVDLETAVLRARQSLHQAKASVANAKSSLDRDKTAKPYNQHDVDAAAHELAAAKAGAKTAWQEYEHAHRLQQEGHAAAVESYNAAVTAQQASYMNYEQAITDADQRTVTAPISGYITTLAINNGDQIGSGSSSSKTSSGGTGSSSSNSAPIVISSLSKLQAQVQIAETDRPKVKRGQKVQVTFDAVPDLTITGKVTQIDAVGTSSSGVVTYNVTVSFDVQDKRLNPGMTAAASIITEVHTDVLMVPNAAVKTDSSGGSYVQVLDAPNGTPRSVTVTVGAADDTNTEIVSGLSGTENVVTQTITAGSSTTGARSGLSVLGGGGGARLGGFRGGN
jgi:multidrug efflux pump subunit AcrA (membrane-fusion protein)